MFGKVFAQLCLLYDCIYDKGEITVPCRHPSVSMFTTEFYVCGLAAYGDHLVTLTYDENGVTQEVRNHL